MEVSFISTTRSCILSNLKFFNVVVLAAKVKLVTNEITASRKVIAPGALDCRLDDFHNTVWTDMFVSRGRPETVPSYRLWRRFSSDRGVQHLARSDFKRRKIKRERERERERENFLTLV